MSVGIDFGCSYYCICIMKNDVPEVVADSQGERQIPGVVSFCPDMPPLIGHEAERRQARNWQNTVLDLKTLLGATFDDLQKIKGKWGFKISAGKRGFALVDVESQDAVQKLAPQEIVAKIFAKLKETAEEALHQKVNSACVTVPVNISESCIEALHEASKLAGFTETHLIHDPTAAIIAYDLDKPEHSGMTKNVVVVDFGSKVDVSLAKVQGGLIRIEKSETCGLTASAIEKELMNYFGQEFRRKTGLDYTESRRAVVKLQSECARVKKDLSQMQQTNIQADGFHEGCDLNSSITRARFEALTDNLLKGIILPIQNIVTLAGGIENIHYVILTGGSIKTPKIQQYIRQYFSVGSAHILSSIDPLEVNARGAAIQASLIAHRNPMLKKKKEVQATSLSIGITAHDGTFVPVIPRDSVIPIRVAKNFGIAPNQKKFVISLYEGENTLSKDNHFLGQFEFQFQPDSNTSKVEFTFTIDNNGILKVVGACKGKTETFKLEGVKKKLSLEEAAKFQNV